MRVILRPKGSGHIGPQVVIDTPVRGRIGGRSRSSWADGRRIWTQPGGTGIDTLHVWAYPITGGAPLFLGVASPAARPDVAACTATSSRPWLRPGGAGPDAGHYDLAVFAWSRPRRVRAGEVVRVTVRD